MNVSFIAPFTGASGNTYEIVTTNISNGITGNFASISPPNTFTTTTGPFSSVLTQSGGSSPAPTPPTPTPPTPTPSPSTSSSSTSASMQSINDVVALDERPEKKPRQEQVLEDQKKGVQTVGICGAGS